MFPSPMTFLDATIRMVIVSIVGASLPVEVALLPPDLGRRHRQLRTSRTYFTGEDNPWASTGSWLARGGR
jgi:hypothetical protein